MKKLSLIALSVLMINTALHARKMEPAVSEQEIEAQKQERAAYSANQAEQIHVTFTDARGTKKYMSPKKTETIGQIKGFLIDQGYLKGHINPNDILLTLAEGNVALLDDTKMLADVVDLNQEIIIMIRGKNNAPAYLDSEPSTSPIVETQDIIID